MIGFYLCLNENDFISTNGQIQNISCNTSNNLTSNYFTSNYYTQCQFNLTYTVGSTQYSKVITIDKSSIPTQNTITVYYKESDPNVMRLYNFNYLMIGIILIIIGIFILISSIYFTNNINFISEPQVSESNLYTKSDNSIGVVYTKM
jgi:hypothetical protein